MRGPTTSLVAHLQIAKTSFLRRSHYRFELLFESLRAVVVVLVLVAVWTQVYTGRSQIGGFTLRQLITYTCAANCLALLFNVDLAYYLSDKIRKGGITFDLIRPVNPHTYYFSDNLGGVLFTALFAVVPTFGVLAALFHIRVTHTADIIGLVVLTTLGFLVHYLFCHLLALTTFYTVDAWGIEALRITLVRFFAGGFVPLVLLPGALQTPLRLLPFPYMIFPAASAVAGTFPPSAFLPTVEAQLFWILALAALDGAAWRLVSRTVTVHGG